MPSFLSHKDKFGMHFKTIILVFFIYVFIYFLFFIFLENYKSEVTKVGCIRNYSHT